MIRFGPSGNSDSFYSEGNKGTRQAAEWIAAMGLNAYEYPFGRGVRMSAEAAEEIRREMAARDIAVSAHAPYFINLANPDPEKREASFRYILETAEAVRLLGGDRIVVHTGAVMKLEREEALRGCREGLREALHRLEDAGLGDTKLCIETMGKRSQIGDDAEIFTLCAELEPLVPCVDFAHLHALTGGGLRGTEDFAPILDRAERMLGRERASRMHIHFSTIEYTATGEKRHRTFAEAEYGPRFEQLAPLLKEREYGPVVICESKGTMAEDAAEMKRIWNELK